MNGFWDFYVPNFIIFQYSKRVCIFLHTFLFFEKSKYENYNFFTNNIISVENANVLQK
jgi:hypothetical protein